MTSWQEHRKFAETMTPTDGTYRGNCPACGGHNTFTSSDVDGVIVYNCYKLGCNVKGTIKVGLTAEQVMNRLRPESKPRKPEAETMEIPAYMVSPTSEHWNYQRFVRRWGVYNYPGLMYDVKQERVVFPILYKGRIIDAVGRAVGQRKLPKWYRYTGAADYFTVGKGDNLLIVEDVVSAIVATQYLDNVTAMAILGTSLTERHIQKAGEYTKVVVALDPDAVKKSLEYRREINVWTGVPTVAINLHDDIKYRNAEDIEKLKELFTRKCVSCGGPTVNDNWCSFCLEEE
jgi:hypothetical protein